MTGPLPSVSYRFRQRRLANKLRIYFVVALAIQMNATLDDLAIIYAAHPTFSELVFKAARRV